MSLVSNIPALAICFFLTVLAACLPVLAGEEAKNLTPWPKIVVAQSVSCGATCGRVNSCEAAVYLWCVCGYRRADRDRDGVPCEKLCGQSTPQNLKRIKAIKQDLGCR